MLTTSRASRRRLAAGSAAVTMLVEMSADLRAYWDGLDGGPIQP